MANWIEYSVDVLANSPTEINDIAERLPRPSDEIVGSLAAKFGESRERVTEFLRDLMKFRSVTNLGYVHETVNKARRFEFMVKDRHESIFESQLFEVSGAFPTAIFLLESWDRQYSWAAKGVIRSGELVRSTRDDDQKAQAQNWVLLDIFAPFRSEYEGGLEFGSLWRQWLEDVTKATELLKAG